MITVSNLGCQNGFGLGNYSDGSCGSAGMAAEVVVDGVVYFSPKLQLQEAFSLPCQETCWGCKFTLCPIYFDCSTRVQIGMVA
ncbi:hypothetical protein HanRHA438_Chr05g0208361 [Helianthus annuus]|nr:hypothetical protein HanRHA438_Chr05g0208361 [Helianthus annuus]